VIKLKRKKTGQYVVISTVGGETCKAFIPDPLPPIPALKISPDLQETMDKALLALGSLNSVSTLLPDTALFLYMYVRKEAVLSSQIEGTQSSLSDLLMYESEAVPGVPIDDVQEVSSYVAAMDYGLKRLKEGFPLSLRLLREIHGKLLSHGRGKQKDPGEFRRSQNWIGGSRPGNSVYVPPPPGQVQSCMGDLEGFMHNKPTKTPLLLKAALAHVQFESIHPFLDGNGRLGRLMITLLLCAEGALSQPMLYLSLFFKAHRQDYYDLLQGVRVDGDWEKWLAFFLRGVKETAEQAVGTAQRLASLFKKDRKNIGKIGQAAGSALRVHHALQQTPIMPISKAAEYTGLTIPTVTGAMNRLTKLGITYSPPKTSRSRLYVYGDYVRILSEGTEMS
jgi:Fic family protein